MMQIIYRISPYKPDNAGVFHTDDKFALINMCHDSFLKAGGCEYDITYILVDCPHWSTKFEKHGKIVNLTGTKKLQSLYVALDMARKLEDKVFLVEDDYLWRPNTIPLLETALNELPVISPYDHPAHYIEERFDKKFEIRLIGNQTYRTCPSNTHTFATRGKVIADHWDLFVDEKKQIAKYDHPAFSELNKYAQMWCPLYSFATHLAFGCLAPNINWLELAT